MSQNKDPFHAEGKPRKTFWKFKILKNNLLFIEVFFTTDSDDQPDAPETFVKLIGRGKIPEHLQWQVADWMRGHALRKPFTPIIYMGVERIGTSDDIPHFVET
jgi:hypothetical protein